MPWQQKVHGLFGRPVGIAFTDGTGTFGILCGVQGGQVYVVRANPGVFRLRELLPRGRRWINEYHSFLGAIMKTYIYMVRHGESPKTEGNERTRGLTDKGKADAFQITELLKTEGIEVFVSSPYRRAILTIQESAQCAGKEILIFEDLKERMFSSENFRMSDNELLPLLNRSFSDPNFALPGGESNTDCQNRAITVLKELLKEYQGQKIAIGTHGAVMTLMMGYFDSQYDLNFLLHTSKPDIYKMEFCGQALVEVKRLWALVK